jgi:hypothetical protein
MPRIDYDEIKAKYEALVKTFKSGEVSLVDDLCAEDVKSWFSVRPSHFMPLDKSAIKDFISNFPRTDELHLPIYNYACRLNLVEAQNYGQVVAIATNEKGGSEELDYFHFVIMLCCHWAKIDGSWKIDELKLDVHPMTGNLQDYFAQTWHISYPLADLEQDDNIPCIQGEFDSPWIRIPDAEDVLSEAEKIKECVAKRFFGMDHFVVDHTVDAYSKSLNVNSKRYAKGQGVRALIGGLRFKRQKDRYWCHPWRFETLEIDGDHAYALTYRVAGYIQRNHEYVWTKANQNVEHMCQICWMDFIKENGVWRIVYNDITLGLYEIDEYDDEHLYRDRV